MDIWLDTHCYETVFLNKDEGEFDSTGHLATLKDIFDPPVEEG